MAQQPLQVVQPNLYQLSGGALQITYATTGIDGQPHFTYQDPQQTLTFRGEQIRSVETDLGLVVSVSIRITVDAGSTTFSLLVPRVNLVGEQSVPVRTEGITTIHRFSIAPAFDQGQRDFYTVTPLSGSASRVFF